MAEGKSYAGLSITGGEDRLMHSINKAIHGGI